MSTKKIKVNNNSQKDYEYVLEEKEGKNFNKDFKPELTPKEMLELGVFGGDYLNDSKDEFPSDWFTKAKISNQGYDESLNFFQVKASQSLKEWQSKGWIYPLDPKGWFQWYCRYYLGRRIPEEDQRQIKRWKAIKRHISQISKNCKVGDINCRKKQRQAVLHWAYDSRKI